MYEEMFEKDARLLEECAENIRNQLTDAAERTCKVLAEFSQRYREALERNIKDAH